MRPEIEANENKVREQCTTAHKARSLGRETVHPSTFEETAIAVMKEFDWTASSDVEDISEPVITAVDEDHTVSSYTSAGETTRHQHSQESRRVD